MKATDKTSGVPKASAVTQDHQLNFVCTLRLRHAKASGRQHRQQAWEMNSNCQPKVELSMEAQHAAMRIQPSCNLDKRTSCAQGLTWRLVKGVSETSIPIENVLHGDILSRCCLQWQQGPPFLAALGQPTCRCLQAQGRGFWPAVLHPLG